ncbi:hypothetical protein D0Y65_032346 [Glycine soja]|uniref:Uncharacterized protein n=1 Tax=Glycine soja TaxID=3848 RepID=A0A445ICL3_GLYSO|nr:hypothetical protein D0Y65_032346 [Glycine soja]
MDLHDPNRFRNRKQTLSSRERFLGVPSSHAPRIENSSSSATDDDVVVFSNNDDLIEDDVVFSNNDDSTEPSSSSQIPNRHHNHNNHHKAFAFGPSDASFGILAALPENDHASSNGSHFFHHKPSVSVSVSVSLSSSSSSSAAARLIPAIPKPPPERTPSSSSSLKFHQSAPVNVPLMPMRRHHRRDFDDDDDATEEMLPPHEIVARNSAQSPMLAYSVLEGVGRTLKGRDLRQTLELGKVGCSVLDVWQSKLRDLNGVVDCLPPSINTVWDLGIHFVHVRNGKLAKDGTEDE